LTNCRNILKNEDELRTIWSVPATRKTFLEKLEEAGYGKDESMLKKVICLMSWNMYRLLLNQLPEKNVL
jgi:hypothetical protein